MSVNEMKKLPEFSGPFKDIIPKYIEYRAAQGIKISVPFVYHLRRMDLFFKDMGIVRPEITREMYDEWTKIMPPEKESNTQKRQSALRSFAKYLVAMGYENIYTGYDDTRIFKRDFIPYVFSREEIERMFSVLSSRCENNPCYDNDAFRIAMLLYYCCGLRKSEAQSLRVKDVDFDTGKISVLHGKNDVSRIIVVSDSLLVRTKTCFTVPKAGGILNPCFTRSSTPFWKRREFLAVQMVGGSVFMTCAIPSV